METPTKGVRPMPPYPGPQPDARGRVHPSKAAKAPATAPAQTTCCHRPHCTDAACPGRADRPPHPAQLHNHNSDGSCPGYDPRQTIQPDWFDDLLFWLQMAFIAMTAAALFGVAAGYFWV